MVGPYQTFRTERFRAGDAEDDEGRAFADWLAGELRERGVPVRRILRRDFGWAMTLTGAPFHLRVECGSRNEKRTEWGAYVVADPPLITRIFRMAELRGEVERLSGVLARIAASLAAGDDAA